jgi:ATP-dependent DNA ligase
MNDIPAPMLVSETPGHKERIRGAGHVFVQPKLDGWRCMANTRTRKIYTRTGREITTLPHINAALPTEGPEWLDGELYKHRVGVDKVQSMAKRGDGTLKFHVFDCVEDLPFEVRMQIVYEAMLSRPIITEPNWGHNETVRPVIYSKAMPFEIDRLYHRYLLHGYEGIIVRLDGVGYEHKRSVNVFKIKPGTEGV